VSAKSAVTLATERNNTALRMLANAERGIATNHRRRKAWALAAIHDCAARQLDDLLRVLGRADNAEATRIDATATHNTHLGGF
jgi:hypothetical protein